jgi:SAM-dependent methyltransferase
VERGLFDSMAVLEDHHWWFRGRGEMVCTLVERESAARGGCVRRLVDVGSGTGAVLGELRRFADEAIGVEPDAVPLEIARGRGLDIRQAPADALPFADASVDLLTAFDVLEHLEDDVAAAREFRRVLRPGGAVIVTVPAYQWLWGAHDVLHAHVRRYTRRTLARTLGAAGLEVKRSGYFMTLLLPLAIAERGLARLTRRRPGPLTMPPGPVNRLLLRLFLSERRHVRTGGFPFGLSVFVVAHPGRPS